jgi:ASC-1-like (ASCH) protein
VFQPSKLSQDRFSKLLRRPAEAPKPEQDAIRDILQILRDYYSVLLEKITSRMDGPNVNFSDEPAVDQLVAKFPDPEQEFFYHLFHTQMFAVFSDHLLRLMSGTSLVQKKKLIAKLDDMIAEEEKQQAGIISVLKIYETLAADAKSDEMAKIKADSEKLEGTLKQSNEKLTSMRQSREKLEKEIAVIEREKNSREGDAALS